MHRPVLAARAMHGIAPTMSLLLLTGLSSDEVFAP